MGDEFSLNGVYCTLSLFFAGLGLVFKSRVRWGFFGLGSVIFLGALVYMCRLEWTRGIELLREQGSLAFWSMLWACAEA